MTKQINILPILRNSYHQYQNNLMAQINTAHQTLLKSCEKPKRGQPSKQDMTDQFIESLVDAKNSFSLDDIENEIIETHYQGVFADDQYYNEAIEVKQSYTDSIKQKLSDKINEIKSFE